MNLADPSYDALLLDLDGVVYIGNDAVPHAVEQLNLARRREVRLCSVTNNAARTPQTVARHLTELGVETSADEVLTSAQGAATLLRSLLEPGSRVWSIGGEGLEIALAEQGLSVASEPERAVAVVSGYHPELPWHRVIDGGILLTQGLPWVASNRDFTVPTPRGPGPGHGALVKLLCDFSGREPVVAGKPEPTLFSLAMRRLGAHRPLVVGDRLDTDVAGAHAAGMDSLLVLTGVTDAEQLRDTATSMRPTWVAEDLRGLPGGPDWARTVELTLSWREHWNRH